MSEKKNYIVFVFPFSHQKIEILAVSFPFVGAIYHLIRVAGEKNFINDSIQQAVG